jgi:hypothetical protein
MLAELIACGPPQRHTVTMAQKITVALNAATIAERERRIHLSRELIKLDPAEERRLSEEGIGDESWPVFSVDDHTQ